MLVKGGPADYNMFGGANDDNTKAMKQNIGMEWIHLVARLLLGYLLKESYGQHLHWWMIH